MKVTTLAIIFCFFILLSTYSFDTGIVNSDSGSSFYVSNDGSDSNSGLSPNQPWATISKVNGAVSDGTISQGDNIYFERGDDFSQTGALYPRLGGTADNYMIFGAYGTGEKPIISNTEPDGRTIEGDHMGNTGYYRFENLEIRDCDRHGIRIRETGVHDLIFSHIDFYNTGDYGIHLQHTDTFKIENCNYINGGRSGFLVHGTANGADPTENGKIWNCTVDGAAFDGIVFHYLGTDEGNYVGSNMWIENCTMNDCGEAGIDTSFGTNPNANLYVKDVVISNCSQAGIAAGHSTQYELYDNVYIHDCNDGFLASRDRNLIMRSCIIENSNDQNLVINQNVNNYNCVDLAFYNNVFSDSGRLVDILRDETGITDNLHFKNNILYSPTTLSNAVYYRGAQGMPDLTDTNSHWINNVYWGSSGAIGNHWYDGENGELDWTGWTSQPEVVGDQRFNPLFDNGYYLQESSPCIDAGDWLTTTTDSGTGTTITVDEANYFFDGYNIQGLKGDNIFVGEDTNLLITDINYDAETITVNRSITWSDNEYVSLLSYCGSKPDIGAYEFPSEEPDNNKPAISNVLLTESDPLDTNPSFGWVNITADVTETSSIDNVKLIIIYPDGSSDNLTMNSDHSNNYYFNTSTVFSDYGNYSYHIWAIDSNGNQSNSTIHDFSMPPNWDIDMNEKCNLLDLTFISNQYNEEGENGFIREDVDNNGEVKVLDFMYVVGHLTQSWYE